MVPIRQLGNVKESTRASRAILSSKPRERERERERGVKGVTVNRLIGPHVMMCVFD